MSFDSEQLTVDSYLTVVVDYSLQFTASKVDCFLQRTDPGVIPLYGRPLPDMQLLLCIYNRSRFKFASTKENPP